jgi:hypothetical protein
MVADDPRAPAEAYYAMAKLLPQGYFVTEPPSVGVRLAVTGKDNVRTTWDMSEWQASQVVKPLRKKGYRVESTNYASGRAA